MRKTFLTFCAKAILVFLLLVSGFNNPILAGTQLGEIVIDVVEEEKPSDGFWQWYVEHIGQVGQFNKELTLTRIQLAHLASEITRARAEHFNLDRMRLGWLASKDESISFAGWNLGKYFKNSIIETSKVGPQARRVNQRRRQQLDNDIRSWQQAQKTLINRTLKAGASLISSTKAQQEKSKDKRPALDKELTRLEQQQNLLPLFLYDYAGWHAPDQLPRLIKDFVAKEPLDRDLEFLLKSKAKVGDAQDLERQAFFERLKPSMDNKQRALFARATIKGDPLGYLAGKKSVNNILKTVTVADVYQTTSQTQRLDAIALLREILRTNKNHPEAKALLLSQELYWLKRIAQKLQGQSEMAMSAFSQYLKNRGFDPIHREGWWPWLKDYASAVWGLGPISMFAGVPGIDLPGANAELAGSQVMEAARYQVAMVAIIRLLKAGHTLSELKAMDSGVLQSLLQRYWALSAKSSSKHRKSVTKIAVDIHATLRGLRDLDRLSTDDGDRFGFAQDVNEFFAKNYFVPVDSRYQSFEWFGDLLNVHNVVTLWGPGAITKVGGKWARAPYMSFAQQDRLQKTGYSLSALSRSAISRVLDSQKVMVYGYNLDTIGNMVRNSRSVKLLARAHDVATRPLLTGKLAADLLGESSKILAAGKTFARLVADSSKFAAAFYINHAVTEAAKTTGIPGMALLTELLMSYEVPAGIYDYLVLKAPATPLTGMVPPLGRYLKHIQGNQRLALQAKEWVEEASELLTAAQRMTTDAARAGQRGSKNLSRLKELRIKLRKHRLEQIHAMTGGSDSIVPPVSGGQSIDDVASRITIEEIPQSTLQGSEDALMSSVSALRQGDLDEAQEALEAASTLAQTSRQDAEKISSQVSKVIDDLESVRPSRVTVDDSGTSTSSARSSDDAGSTSPHESIELGDSIIASGSNGSNSSVQSSSSPGAGGITIQNTKGDIEDIVFKVINDRDYVRPLIDPDLYEQGLAGEQLRLADKAGIQGDDFDGALAHLDEARKFAQDLDEPNGALERFIEKRKALIAHARDARAVILQRRGESHSFPALKEISTNERSQILQKLKNGDFKGTKTSNKVHIEVTVGNSIYRIKPDQSATKVEAEVVGGAMADLVGFDTPASTILDAKGEIVLVQGSPFKLDQIAVTRKIDQLVPLEQLEEPVLLALRSDYANQKVLRAWLADSDGHLGNIGLGPNGKLWVIDTDLANFSNIHSLKQLNGHFQNEEELIEAALTMAHGNVPPPQGVDPKDVERFMELIKSKPLYQWMHRADQMISPRDLAPTLERIQKVMSSKGAFIEKLQRRGVDLARAHEIFELLDKRKNVLEEVLMKPSLFGGDGVKMSALQREMETRLALFPLSWKKAA